MKVHELFSPITEARMGKKDFSKINTKNRTLGFEVEVIVDPDYERDFDSSDITELYVMKISEPFLVNLLQNATVKPEAYAPKYLVMQHEVPYERLKKAVAMPENTDIAKKEKLRSLGFGLNKASKVDDHLVNETLTRYVKEAEIRINEYEEPDNRYLAIDDTAGERRLLNRRSIPWQYLSKVFTNGWEIMKKFSEYCKKKGWIDRDLTLETYEVLQDYGINDKQWRVIEDTSLYPANCGRELVSTVFDFDEGIDQLKNILNIIRKEWFTTKSCGIHINIGSWNTKEEQNKVDLLKFIMFFDEDYVLNLFSRSKNDFAKSVFSKLKAITNTHSDGGKNFEKFTNVFLANVELINTEILKWAAHHDVVDFGKFTSGYLEIRAAGGAEYEKREADILNLVKRSVRALELAEDPSAARNEYLKKVYALIKASSFEADLNLSRTTVIPEYRRLKSLFLKLEDFKTEDGTPFNQRKFDYYTDKFKGLRNFLDVTLNFIVKFDNVNNVPTKYKTVLREIVNEYKSLTKPNDFDRTITSFKDTINNRTITSRQKKTMLSILPNSKEEE